MKGNMVSRESTHYQTLVLRNWMSWISNRSGSVRMWPLPIHPHF